MDLTYLPDKYFSLQFLTAFCSISSPRSAVAEVHDDLTSPNLSILFTFDLSHHTPSMTPKVFLVTGSSSGFGREVVEKILKQGDIAIATLRKVEALDDLQVQYPASQLLIVPLDITKPEEVSAAFARAKATFGRLDVVVNKAGISDIGEAEGTPTSRVRAIFG